MLNLFKRADPAARDRRRLHREPVRAEAVLLFANRLVPCSTVDLSDGGAKIAIPASVMLPGRFHVEVRSRKIRRPARLVWRSGDQLGVEFER